MDHYTRGRSKKDFERICSAHEHAKRKSLTKTQPSKHQARLYNDFSSDFVSVFGQDQSSGSKRPPKISRSLSSFKRDIQQVKQINALTHNIEKEAAPISLLSPKTGNARKGSTAAAIKIYETQLPSVCSPPKLRRRKSSMRSRSSHEGAAAKDLRAALQRLWQLVHVAEKLLQANYDLVLDFLAKTTCPTKLSMYQEKNKRDINYSWKTDEAGPNYLSCEAFCPLIVQKAASCIGSSAAVDLLPVFVRICDQIQAKFAREKSAENLRLTLTTRKTSRFICSGTPRRTTTKFHHSSRKLSLTEIESTDYEKQLWRLLHSESIITYLKPSKLTLLKEAVTEVVGVKLQTTKFFQHLTKDPQLLSHLTIEKFRMEIHEILQHDEDPHLYHDELNKICAKLSKHFHLVAEIMRLAKVSHGRLEWHCSEHIADLLEDKDLSYSTPTQTTHKVVHFLRHTKSIDTHTLLHSSKWSKQLTATFQHHEPEKHHVASPHSRTSISNSLLPDHRSSTTASHS